MHAGLINAIRGFIYAGLAYAFFHKTINQMTKRDLKIGLIAGGINFLGYQLQTIGLMYTTPANNAFLTAIYAWATLAFGIRFSNLTYRGVLTNGPYRFTRHPAYVSKNLFWWLSVLPFMVSSGSMVAITVDQGDGRSVLTITAGATAT